MNNNKIDQQIGNLYKRLSKPLTSTDKENGWREKIQQDVLLMLNGLQDDVNNNVDISNVGGYRSLARSLDYCGVLGGELLEGFAQLSALIRAREAKE